MPRPRSMEKSTGEESSKVLGPYRVAPEVYAELETVRKVSGLSTLGEALRLILRMGLDTWKRLFTTEAK